FMKEAFRDCRSEIMGAHSGSSDAKSIGDDSHRNGSDGNQPSDPPSGIHKIPIDNSESQQRYQRSDAAAGFSHGKTRVGQMNNIAFSQNRYSGNHQSALSKSRSK